MARVLQKNFRSPVRRYQEQLRDQLKQMYPSVQVLTEWVTMKDEKGIYSPRLDIAVGPFAIKHGFIREYDKLMDTSEHFISRLIEYHMGNIKKLDEQEPVYSTEIGHVSAQIGHPVKVG